VLFRASLKSKRVLQKSAFLGSESFDANLDGAYYYLEKQKKNHQSWAAKTYTKTWRIPSTIKRSFRRTRCSRTTVSFYMYTCVSFYRRLSRSRMEKIGVQDLFSLSSLSLLALLFAETDIFYSLFLSRNRNSR